MFACALSDAWASCKEYVPYLRHGGYGVADSSGSMVESCHPDQQFIPASTIKIITAYASLKILGEAYRFSTLFFWDKEHNLYIKGFGDPLLLSEDVAEITAALQLQGITELHHIFIDNSAYALDGRLPPGSEASENPYDAPVGATAVNFNSMAIVVDKQGRVHSGEEQTPTLPFMAELAQGKRAGTYRLNICSKGCQPETVVARHSAELFTSFLTLAGISVTGSHGIRRVPDDAKLVYVHQNPRSLDYILTNMLHYSSNFIANQLFLLCGAKRFGFPATWDKGVRAMYQVLEESLDEQILQSITITDGAGLSRENSMSIEAMLSVLKIFAPYKTLLRSYRGTLAKTGTLEGVYNYAGYFKNGKRYAIFLNQPKNYRATLLDQLKKKNQ